MRKQNRRAVAVADPEDQELAERSEGEIQVDEPTGIEDAETVVEVETPAPDETELDIGQAIEEAQQIVKKVPQIGAKEEGAERYYVANTLFDALKAMVPDSTGLGERIHDGRKVGRGYQRVILTAQMAEELAETLEQQEFATDTAEGKVVNRIKARYVSIFREHRVQY